MKKNIFIHIFKKQTSTKIASYYLELYKDLIKKFKVKIYIIYLEDKDINLDLKKQEELEKIWLEFLAFENIEEIKNFLNSIKENNIQIYTYYEELISLSNELKKFLGQKITEIDDLFISKKLQRENLLSFNKDITVNFLKFNDIEKVDKNLILKNFDFPFIIKPSFWISSSWVVKINSEIELEDNLNKLKEVFENLNKNRKIKNYEIIIEEFIDWKMYTIDYFIWENNDLQISSLIRTKTLKDEYNIDDFWITNEILWEKIEKEIDKKDLLDFLNQNIKACKIKNTFVHHEFKLTSSWKLKTIELNWRIWWYRPEMYKKAYDLNLLEFLFNKNTKIEFKQYYQFIWLFPRKETWKIFEWLNTSFIEQIKNLKSYFSYMIKESFIGKKIWFTKNWYKYFWSIRLINKNFDEIEKDYIFIKENLDKNIIYK